MLDHKYGCLPVERDGKLVGILTEADFLRLTVSFLDQRNFLEQETDEGRGE